MSAAVLSSLTSTRGVRGAALFDGNDACVAHDLPAPLQPLVVTRVLRRVLAAADVFLSLGTGTALNSFSVRCDSGIVVVRRTSSHTVLALAVSGVDLNLLHVALNVLMLRLEHGDLDVDAGNGSTHLSGSGPPRHEVQREPVAEASSMAAASITWPEVGDVAMGGPASPVPHTSASPETSDGPSPIDALGRTAVLELLQIFARYMGPAAPVVMKRQLAGLGVSSRTLRASQYEVLLARLADRLPAGPRQQQFLQDAWSTFNN